MSFRSCREKAGMQVADVAMLLGVNKSAVYQWETKFSSPTVDKLKKLAILYRCTTDELLKEDKT